MEVRWAVFQGPDWGGGGRSDSSGNDAVWQSDEILLIFAYCTLLQLVDEVLRSGLGKLILVNRLCTAASSTAYCDLAFLQSGTWPALSGTARLAGWSSRM